LRGGEFVANQPAIGAVMIIVTGGLQTGKFQTSEKA
jgi:hypothetical protein